MVKLDINHQAIKYHINGHNKCPRCKLGVIISDIRSKVCLCCGLREDIEAEIDVLLNEAIIAWLVRNIPHEAPPEFHKPKGYI